MSHRPSVRDHHVASQRNFRGAHRPDVQIVNVLDLIAFARKSRTFAGSIPRRHGVERHGRTVMQQGPSPSYNDGADDETYNRIAPSPPGEHDGDAGPNDARRNGGARCSSLLSLRLNRRKISRSVLMPARICKVAMTHALTATIAVLTSNAACQAPSRPSVKWPPASSACRNAAIAIVAPGPCTISFSGRSGKPRDAGKSRD